MEIKGSVKTTLKNKKIGIIGCGHLGLAFAKAFIKGGLSQSDLLISYSGNPDTLKRIEHTNLLSSLSNNNQILAECDYIFLLVRPNQIDSILVDGVKEGTVVISCMAGLSIEMLFNKFNRPVIRIMPTNPKSIVSGKGMYGIFPENKAVENLLGSLKLRGLTLKNEASFLGFTAISCLLTLLLYNEVFDITELTKEEIYSKDYIEFKDFIDWSINNTPSELTYEEKEKFIKSAATPGGVTEAVLTEFKRSKSLSKALKAGEKKAREISERATVN